MGLQGELRAEGTEFFYPKTLLKSEILSWAHASNPSTQEAEAEAGGSL